MYDTIIIVVNTTFANAESLYSYVFERIRCSFKAHENKLSLLDKIESRTIFTNDKSFSVLPSNSGYSFSVTQNELEQYPEICDFLAAHEIHHAMIHEKSLEQLNKHSFLQTEASKFLSYSSKKITYHADSISQISSENSPFISVRYHLSSIDFWEMSGKLASMVYNYASQAEELECDKFAAKLFPETSLKKFSEFLDVVSESDNKNLLETHPTNKKRLTHLKKYLRD